MALPPGILARDLVETFPQFVMCDPALEALLASYLAPGSNPTMSDLIQWLQDNPAAAQAAGNVLQPPGAPQTAPVPLEAGLVAALVPSLIGTSAWIAGETEFKDIAWSVQPGKVPGPVAVQAGGNSWTIDTQGPIAGLAFDTISWSEDMPGFALKLRNLAPRYLSAYAEFLKDGVPVIPAGWSSRLPKAAPSAFETDRSKYLGLLLPNLSVAGIVVGGTAQTLACPLPSNADAVRLRFGGLAANGFTTAPDAPGVLMTAVLCMFVPWLAAYSRQNPKDLAKWYGKLLADPDLAANVFQSGAFLDNVDGASALYAALSANLTSTILGAPLAGLRAAITKEFGKPDGADYGWAEQLAPAAGWAAQLLQPYLASGVSPQYWPASTPADLGLPLSPATALDIEVTVRPDPESGVWPYAAAQLALELTYDGGFTQALATAVTGGSATPVVLDFGAVATSGSVLAAVKVTNAKDAVVSSAEGSIAPVLDPGARRIAAELIARDVPGSLTGSTEYRRVARLKYEDDAYIWDADAADAPASSPGHPVSGVASVTELVCLSFQASQHCLGYAWRASNQHATVCGGSGALSDPFYLQNIGAAVPGDQLETIACGLAAAPQLAYAPLAGDAGYYADTQGIGVYLRPVRFGTGPFDLGSGKSLAQFAPQSASLAFCIAGGRHVAAVNTDASILEIATLAPDPINDADAPKALSHCGPGARIGLLASPVAMAATPSGALLVLEQGNARVQAFDLASNPMPIFSGACAFGLRQVPNLACHDIVVAPNGAILVLASQNNGQTAEDWFLDIYTATGTLLATLPGICAAKIALDAQLTLYTLDFDTLTGPNGRIEPVISIWQPIDRAGESR